VLIFVAALSANTKTANRCNTIYCLSVFSDRAVILVSKFTPLLQYLALTVSDKPKGWFCVQSVVKVKALELAGVWKKGEVRGGEELSLHKHVFCVRFINRLCDWNLVF